MFRQSFFLMALVLIAGSVFAQTWTFSDVSGIVGTQPEYASVVCWGDVNKDGYPDLFVGGGAGTASHLYLYDQGFLRDATSTYGLLLTSAVRKAEFIDFNRDGLMDLSIVTDDAQGVRLFKQSVDGQFTELHITGDMEFTTPIRDAMWCDMDHDGTLDLVLSNGTSETAPMAIFTQDVGEEFVEMRDNPWENLTGVGSIAASDFDRDGQAEYFFGWGAGDDGAHFYLNMGGTYQDWARHFDFPAKLGYRGVAWLDYDNDGRMDFVCTGSPDYTAEFHGAIRYGMDGLELIEDPSFTDKAAGGYDLHAVDANVDGWTDLFITKPAGIGNALLINDNGTSWTDVAATVGVRNSEHDNLSAAWGDFDRDGDMDLAVAQGGEGVRIFRNNLRKIHQSIELNLLYADTHTPVQNCNVKISWQFCKQIASTYPSASSSGGDVSSLLLVNRTFEKAEEVILKVSWPNGIQSEYFTNRLRVDEINNLYMPTPGLEPLATTNLQVASPQTVAQCVSPNPFNPTTNISFNLTEAANVELKVYNLVGREVATLAQGSYSAGEHRLTFNAGALPSGVYFSRLTANGISSMSRMLLMK